MDNVAGAGAKVPLVHGYKRFGIETTGIGIEEGILQTAWSSSWKTRAAFSALPPRLPETEDGEDYMSGLAEEIAQCMLQNNDDGARAHCSAFKNTEPIWGAQPFLSTSPQSTLTGMSSWDLLSPGGSSSGGLSSGVSSPPTPVASSQVRQGEEDALDLLYAELLRLKMEDEIKARQQQLIQLKQQQHFQQLLWKMRQRQVAALSYEAVDALKFNQGHAPFTTSSSTPKAQGSSSLFYRNKARNDETPQVRARKQANGSWAGHQNQGGRQRSWSAGEQCNQTPYAVAYSPNGSHQKTVNGSGMRAVFLGTPGARESGGTGVFLPRRLGSGHDTKRKPACSTVLLPSRIVQALNLNVEDTLAPNSAPTSLLLRRDPVSARARQLPVSGEVMDARDDWAGHSSAACSPLQEVAPDICLPTEWTY